MQKLRKELATAIENEVYDVTEQGIYFPNQGVMAQGQYFDRVNGGEWSVNKNLVVTEGLAHILNVAMGSTPKPTAYYLALFSGATAPAPRWGSRSWCARMTRSG